MTTTKSGGQVEVSITTFDKGDETIRFTSVNGKVTIKEAGKKAESIEVEAAVARMTELKLAGYGDTFEIKKMPAWSV